MEYALICDALRTPFGKYNGALSTIRTDDLAAIPIKAFMDRYPLIDWSDLDDVVFGCANQSGEDNRNVARMAALLAGLPVEVPALTLNRLCASGLDAITYASRAIKAKEADFLIVGGVENMSRAPFVMGKSETAFSRTARLEDTTMGWRFINPIMRETYGVATMPETAEIVATEYNISREDQDAFALRSHQRAMNGYKHGYFSNELIPVQIPQTKGIDNVVFDRDEHIRNTTYEKLSSLKPITNSNGTITAGNSSGINDGSGALILASETAAKRHGLNPRARLIASTSSGIHPRIMGMGPVLAVQNLLEKTGLSLSNIDVFEINEAFAAQSIAVLRQLGLPDDATHVNPNGGAIALGHPLGASGIRLATTAFYQLLRTGGKYALCTMCVGVGQGSAVLIARI
ncbi:3-oxoadipyl-CoA thiolase [Citrobacter werkmanii]|uniref:3-oxoadipyl-CoA thiolase n=1 Tax=Citrobacter werkmanii TaxID=67827 RepID=UPI002728FFFB|nr:3-oxoadipyl-CoA thiolase [Citrobacter werkmanii]MDO8235835.1 3-oxoadipyl-CoA thiolase [Citrobacter werkmanii]